MNPSFFVLYRFRLAPGTEDRFVAAWTSVTEEIRARHGGLGSRLHRDEDGLWYAYARWPSRDAWQRMRDSDSEPSPAQLRMRECIVERLPPVPLDPVSDLLHPD